MMFEEIIGKHNSENNQPLTNIPQEGSSPQQRSYELEIHECSSPALNTFMCFSQGPLHAREQV